MVSLHIRAGNAVRQVYGLAILFAVVMTLAFGCASPDADPSDTAIPSDVAPTATAVGIAPTATPVELAPMATPTALSAETRVVSQPSPTPRPSAPTPEPQPSPTAAVDPTSTPTAESVAPLPKRDFDVITLLPPDAIPAISNPGFYESLEAADESYGDDDLVLGIEINGDSRAYSVPLLSRHEIVNDVVGSEPVAVTW